jgi:hypothetical protein
MAWAVLVAKQGGPLFGFPFVAVGERLEEQQLQELSLVIFDLAAQAGVGDAPEEAAELLFGKHQEVAPGLGASAAAAGSGDRGSAEAGASKAGCGAGFADS